MLEYPVTIVTGDRRIIDIVLQYDKNGEQTFFPIELKCFRLYARGKDTKRSAQNLGMYDYWADIENIEHYSSLANFGFGTQLTVTDDRYYVEKLHRGSQVQVYSTNRSRTKVSGVLEHVIANRLGRIILRNLYSMEGWKQVGNFYAIKQEVLL